jgi:hypothetical protein
VAEDRELFQLSRALTQYPAAVTAIVESASGMRWPIDTISLDDMERIGHLLSH